VLHLNKIEIFIKNYFKNINNFFIFCQNSGKKIAIAKKLDQIFNTMEMD
jgi:hypothetical protein